MPSVKAIKADFVCDYCLRPNFAIFLETLPLEIQIVKIYMYC